MKPIRVIALCVCRHGGRILAQSLTDPADGHRFHRPFGGGVEFGERAAGAVRREFREELEVGLSDLVLLGVMENLFTYDGRPGHEIVFVFDGALEDAAMYARDDLVGRESDGDPVPGAWISLDEVEASGIPLYPEGLLAFLRSAS